MARVSAFPQFNPSDKDLNRFIKGLKITIDSMIQEVNRIDGVSGGLGDIQAELLAIEARIAALVLQINTDAAELQMLIAEANAILTQVTTIRSDLDGILASYVKSAIPSANGQQLAITTTNNGTDTVTTFDPTSAAGDGSIVIDTNTSQRLNTDSTLTTTYDAPTQTTTIAVTTTIPQSDWDATGETNGEILNQPAVVTGIARVGTDVIVSGNNKGTPTQSSFTVTNPLLVDGNETDFLIFESDEGFTTGYTASSKTFGVGLAAATPTTPGTMSAADKTKEDSYPLPNIAVAGQVIVVDATGNNYQFASIAALAGTANNIRCFRYSGQINEYIGNNIVTVLNEFPVRVFDNSTDAYTSETIAVDAAAGLPVRLFNSATQTYISGFIGKI